MSCFCETMVGCFVWPEEVSEDSDVPWQQEWPEGGDCIVLSDVTW